MFVIFVNVVGYSTWYFNKLCHEREKSDIDALICCTPYTHFDFSLSHSTAVNRKPVVYVRTLEE